MKRTLVSLLSVVLCSLGSTAFAKEVAVGLAALPAAVRDSLHARYPNARILHLTREAEKGAVLYEAEMSLSGGKVDALFDSHGRLREEEARIPASDLPEAVRSAIQRRGLGTIVRAERLTSAATPQTPKFEVLVARRRARTEYVYSANGRLLKTQQADRND